MLHEGSYVEFLPLKDTRFLLKSPNLSHIKRKVLKKSTWNLLVLIDTMRSNKFIGLGFLGFILFVVEGIPRILSATVFS